MQLSQIGEFGLIKAIRKQCVTQNRQIVAGIGDDAAVLKRIGENILITADMMIENIHFNLSYTTFRQLGHKFLAVNISDIFAMGGSPKYFVISLGVPGSYTAKDIKSLYSGIMKLAKKFHISVIGGDTCMSEQDLVLSGTLIGSAKRVITRKEAKVGDDIFVSNVLGDSGMGLHILKSREKADSKRADHSLFAPLIRKHLVPVPVPAENISRINAMIDISDGLLIDLSHICDESNVGAVIYKDKIPMSRQLRKVSQNLNVDAHRFALGGGEDYCLLFAAPPNIKTNAFKIGKITKKGRFIIDKRGEKSPFKPEGYEHFKNKRRNIRSVR